MNWGISMDSLYISRVIIKNYRNFRDLDVDLQHKSVIVGENNIGKTNFIKALQLILDPTLSDEDRMLSESDFNDSLENPMENNLEILIQIYISNYRKNVAIMTMLSDATVLDSEGNEVLLLSYKFFLILMNLERKNINMKFIWKTICPENLAQEKENTLI